MKDFTFNRRSLTPQIGRRYMADFFTVNRYKYQCPMNNRNLHTRLSDKNTKMSYFEGLNLEPSCECPKSNIDRSNGQIIACFSGPDESKEWQFIDDNEEICQIGIIDKIDDKNGR